jgi:hypothetical protein
MRESRQSGSVRGAVSNDRPYRDSWLLEAGAIPAMALTRQFSRDYPSSSQAGRSYADRTYRLVRKRTLSRKCGRTRAVQGVSTAFFQASPRVTSGDFR